MKEHSYGYKNATEIILPFVAIRGALKISHFITYLYRTVLEVNYLFHAESARNYLFQKNSSPLPPWKLNGGPLSNIILRIGSIMNSLQQTNNKNSSCYVYVVRTIFILCDIDLLGDHNTRCILWGYMSSHEKKILIKKFKFTKTNNPFK